MRGMLGGQLLRLLRQQLVRHIQLHIQLPEGFKAKGLRWAKGCPGDCVPGQAALQSSAACCRAEQQRRKAPRAASPPPAHPNAALQQLQWAAHKQWHARVPLPRRVAAQLRLDFAWPYGLFNLRLNKTA